MYLAMILQEDLCAYYLLCQRGDNGGGGVIFLYVCNSCFHYCYTPRPI